MEDGGGGGEELALLVTSEVEFAVLPLSLAAVPLLVVVVVVLSNTLAFVAVFDVERALALAEGSLLMVPLYDALAVPSSSSVIVDLALALTAVMLLVVTVVVVLVVVLVVSSVALAVPLPGLLSTPVLAVTFDVLFLPSCSRLSVRRRKLSISTRSSQAISDTKVRSAERAVTLVLILVLTFALLELVLRLVVLMPVIRAFNDGCSGKGWSCRSIGRFGLASSLIIRS